MLKRRQFPPTSVINIVKLQQSLTDQTYNKEIKYKYDVVMSNKDKNRGKGK